MQDRIAELEKRVQELEPVAEPVIRVDTQTRDECVVPEYTRGIATMVHWVDPTVAQQPIAPDAPTISRRFTVQPRFLNGSSMQREGNRVLFQGKRRNIKRNDEYGEYLQFDGMRYYASNTRPYEKKAVIEACPWWGMCKNTPADREAFFDGQLRKRRRQGAIKKWDEMERLNQAFYTQWEVVDGVNVYTRHLLTPLRPAQPVQPVQPAQTEQPEQPEKKKVHVPKHAPEKQATRFIVGTYHPAYGSPTLKIHNIKNTQCGKYVYLEHDYDGEKPTEIYRRKVYFKDGCEYYKEDLDSEQMEMMAREFE